MFWVEGNKTLQHFVSSVMVISAVCSTTCVSEEWRGAQDSQVRQCPLLTCFLNFLGCCCYCSCRFACSLTVRVGKLVVVGFQADVVCFSQCWKVTGAGGGCLSVSPGGCCTGALRQSRSGALSAHLVPMSSRGWGGG